jgi:AmmeMemoRadiSam system protein B
MQTRKSIVAGQFYPGQHDACIDEINRYFDAVTISESLPEKIVAGIVPHAGWTFSGSLAAMVFLAIRQQHEKVHTFVIFGAAHSYFGGMPAVYDKGFWSTPLGEVPVDEELAEQVLDMGPAESNYSVHQSEHSLEVQVPFIQYLFAGAKILPILVPPTVQAITLGDNLGRIIQKNRQKKIVCIGSTDLTHYGPHYGFMPKGLDQDALEWADTVNDKKFIDLALGLEPQDLLTGAAENHNACGPGAAAATIAAAKKLGSKQGVLLAHTNSNKVMIQKMGTSSTDSVGYAAIIY